MSHFVEFSQYLSKVKANFVNLENIVNFVALEICEFRELDKNWEFSEFRDFGKFLSNFSNYCVFEGGPQTDRQQLWMDRKLQR